MPGQFERANGLLFEAEVGLAEWLMAADALVELGDGATDAFHDGFDVLFALVFDDSEHVAQTVGEGVLVDQGVVQVNEGAELGADGVALVEGFLRGRDPLFQGGVLLVEAGSWWGGGGGVGVGGGGRGAGRGGGAGLGGRRGCRVE